LDKYLEITILIELKHKYSDNIFNKKILIIGPYPPPMGGIAVHIKRIRKKLISQNNDVICLDIVEYLKTKGKIGYHLEILLNVLKRSPDFVYYHGLTLWKFPFDLLLLILLKPFFNFKIILVDHTPRFFYKKNLLYKKLINFMFRFLYKQILIGDSTYDSYLDNKIFLNQNYSVESPFLEPDLSEEDKILGSYPETLINFLDSHEAIILLNASCFHLYENVDLYGFDLAIKLLSDLKKNFYNCGLILACGTTGDHDYFKKIKSSIEFNKNIYLLLQFNHELWPLIKRSHIFIRPTSSDAFGISVQEAIYFNVPAIASNVCLRPQGTILFNSRDYDDFYCKVKLELDKKSI